MVILWGNLFCSSLAVSGLYLNWSPVEWIFLKKSCQEVFCLEFVCFVSVGHLSWIAEMHVRQSVAAIRLSSRRASRAWMCFLSACCGIVGVLISCLWVTVQIAKAHKGLPCVYARVIHIFFYDGALPNGGYFKCMSTSRPPLCYSGVRGDSTSSSDLVDLHLLLLCCAKPHIHP